MTVSFVCVSTVADSSSNWAVCGKSSGMVSMPLKANATHKVQIEVMPLFAGHLPFPKIKVLKYLPHTAAVAIQPDPGKTVNAKSELFVKDSSLLEDHCAVHVLPLI